MPEEDTEYFGSFYDKTFNPTGKIIIFTGETRQEVAEIEIELHDFFDVAVNPQFANQAKATSTKFDTTGVPKTGEHKRKISAANTGKTRTENWKKAMSGGNHPQFGVPRTEEWKKAESERKSGENNPRFGVPGITGALNPLSKAIIAIQPDGTELHFGSIQEAARELGINNSSLCSKYLKTGNSPTRGKFKDWRFIYENR